MCGVRVPPFPDLKGQAPLRRGDVDGAHDALGLFLTSKVRLHCDGVVRIAPVSAHAAFS